MGEFYPFYHSPVMINSAQGSKWDLVEFPVKDICRNDLQRTLKIEFFEIRNIKEKDTPIFLAEFDFSLEYLKKYLNKYMNCFCGRLNAGRVKLCQLNLY